MNSRITVRPNPRTRRCLWLLSAAAIFGAMATPASAYILQRTGNCQPGLKWDVSRPVKVRVLDDSVSDYFKMSGAPASTDRTRMDRDIDAVIKLYNSISGSRLVLERGAVIKGDKDLNTPVKDDFGDQTIVIGFTDETLSNNAPAETEYNPADECTMTRVHIRFSKKNGGTPYSWVYGPPDNFECDFGRPDNGTCKAFFTKDQPKPAAAKSFAQTFLGVLTHEMGHAAGLHHPNDNYAIMAQTFYTWLRGNNEVLHTQLMPDDISGILALYGGGKGRVPLDISVSNTWYESNAAQIATACAAQKAKVAAASKALADATGIRIAASVRNSAVSQGSVLLQALADAEDALRTCEDNLNAQQITHCQVSSRADDWANLLAGVAAWCGVNTTTTYPKASEKICPGKQVQLRYTLNNHTKLREVLVKSEVWFSEDMALDTTNGGDIQSPDVRELMLPAASSVPVGQVFRLPSKVPADSSGQTYVFVRAVPYDPDTGASLLSTEADQANNAIMVRHFIRVDSGVCP